MTTFQQLLDGIRRMFVWWFIVCPWEQGIRVRLGNRTRVLGPGIHFRVPLLDRVYVQSIRLRTADVGVQTLSTKDLKTVIVAATIKFAIKDVEQLYNSMHDVRSTVVDLAAASIAQFVAQHESSEVLPRAVEEWVDNDLDLEQYGLETSGLALTDFAYLRAYRIVGQDREWRGGEHIDMNTQASPTGVHPA